MRRLKTKQRGLARRASVTGTPVNLVLNYRPDLSRVVRWELAGAHFVVVTALASPPEPRERQMC